MTNRFFGMTPNRAAAAALLCCMSYLVTGCTSTAMVNGFDSSPVAGPQISGMVHGGEQAVVGATVQVWAVGSTGYGSAATALGSPVTSGPGGVFTVGAYTCPAAPSNGNGNTYVYITATGGNSGANSSNSNIELAAALGPCSGAASLTVDVDEVTTAATAYALGQYFTTTFGSGSTDSFGAPNTAQAQTGIANAFGTFNNLATLSTGAAVTAATLSNNGLSLTTAPEATKLNTVANILATCVNSAGTSDPNGNCNTLFSDVVPAGGVTPTDILQAAVDMSLNPTSNNANGSTANINALFGLQAGYAPFPADLSAAPTDWTIGIRYSDTSANFLLKPQNIALDSNGNVWILSNNSALGGFAEISPTGTPLTVNPTNLNVLLSGSPTSFIFTGTSTNPRNLAIDTNNNVWFTTSSSATDSNSVKANGVIWEYTTGGTSTGYQTAKGAYGLAIDGSNNVFVGQQSGSAVYELFEFPGGNLTEPIGYPIATATAGTAGVSGSNSFIAPEYLAIDPTGNVWMTGGVAGSTFADELTNIAPASTIVAGCSAYPCPLSTSLTSNTYNKVNLGSITGATGLSADTASMFITDFTSGNSVSDVPYASPSSETNIGSTNSFTLPHFDATDGAGNVWVSNNNSTPTGTNPTAGGSVSELSSTGAILSPISSNITVTNPGFVHVGLGNGAGIATDPSGNVWIADNTNSVFEIVGAAVPTVTPIALALEESKVGAKP